jgi:hypothetical protein
MYFIFIRFKKSVFLALIFLLFSLSVYAEQPSIASFTYNSKGKRNPFIPLVTSDGRLIKLEPEEGQTGLTLEGIIYDEQGLSYAIINSKVVKVSEFVGDYQVLKIKENKVILIRGGQTYELEIKKESE